jgi:hypothetical protein
LPFGRVLCPKEAIGKQHINKTKINLFIVIFYKFNIEKVVKVFTCKVIKNPLKTYNLTIICNK